MKFLKPILAVVAIVAVILAFYEPAQKKLADVMVQAELIRVGMKAHTHNVNGNTFYYLDNENTDAEETMILIHGFGGDTLNWAKFAPYVDDYRVIIPDLIGFGLSDKAQDVSYTFEAQGQRVLDLADALGLETYHVAGNSMGGAITMAMGLMAPEKVKTLGLFDPAGVFEFQTEWFKEASTGGDNPLVTKTEEDFFRTYDMAMSKAPFVPWPILKFKARDEVANSALKQEIFKVISTDPASDMTPLLPKIQQPTLVIWGDEDKLLHVGNAQVINKNVPNSAMLIMEGYGHMPMLEAPKQSAKAFVDFIQSQSN